MAKEDEGGNLEETSRKRSIWRRRSFVEDSTRDIASGNGANLRAIKDTARRRADQAIRAYTGAFGELREDLQPSHFELWTLEQMQEFLVSLNVELRGATMLSRTSFVAILESMFKGAAPDELPQPPEPFNEEFKKRREVAARLFQDQWFLKKSKQWRQATVTQPETDGHLEANRLPSPGGVMRAAARGRISEDTPWEPPSIEFARTFHDAMHLRLPEGVKFNVIEAKTGRFCFLGGCGEQFDLWDEGMISHFALYGAGVTSYFKFLKYCCWSFFVVSCAALPNVFVNFNGGSITTVSNTNRISWTTIGNLGGSTNITKVILPFCDAKQYSSCIVEKETVGMYYGYVDAGMVILLLVGYFWVNGFITDEFKTIKRNTVTAADFTVMVKNIPPDVTEEEISNHFSTMLNRKVVEVAIARDNRKCISLYQRSGRLYNQRAATRDLIRYLKTKEASREDRFKSMEEASSTGALGVGDDSFGLRSATSNAAVEELGWFERWRRERQMRQLQAKRERASRMIINLAAEAKLVTRVTNIAMAAYVTFEEEMGAVDARVRYSGSWTRWMFMEQEMRLRGRRIQVSEAEEPSTILWENFGYTSCELWVRRFFTFAAGYSFLTLSVGMSIWALYRNQEADDAGGATPCPADWNTMSSEEQADAVEEDGSILHCLCSGRSTSLLSLDPSDTCFEYIQAVVEAAGLVVATSLIVAATNAGVNIVAKAMGAFEKHTSMDKQEVSTFRRLVLLKFVNIGLTVLITNSRRVIDIIEVNLDYEEDFTPDWYRTLGSSVVMNVMINAITPHLYWLVMWIRRRQRWKRAKENPSDIISQDALHEIAKGGRWEISHRYAEITVIFAVCLAYSAGIPLLLPMGAVSFAVFYWVEKALFVYFYTTPPKYSGKLTHEVINLIPYCLLVHTAFAFYMYGNGSIFPVPVEDGESAEEAVAQASGLFNFFGKLKVKAVQPLVFPLIILSVMILERWVGRTVVTGFSTVVALLTCKGEIASGKLESVCNAVTVDYSRAVVRGILRGLPSYNILLNPKYKESFGLSDSFAARHKRVGSIHMLVGNHPSILEVRKVMRSEASARRAGKRWTPRRKRFVSDDDHNTPEPSPWQQDPLNSLFHATPSSTRSRAESHTSRLKHGAIERSVSHESSSLSHVETPRIGVARFFSDRINQKDRSSPGPSLTNSCPDDTESAEADHAAPRGGISSPGSEEVKPAPLPPQTIAEGGDSARIFSSDEKNEPDGSDV